MASSSESRLARHRQAARPHLFDGFPHLQTRLSLLWLHSFLPLYRKVCPNVLREVSSYLWFFPKLLALDANKLFSYDINSKKTSIEYQPDGFTNVTFMLLGAVYVSDDRAFVVADLDGYCTFFLEKGRMTNLPTLLRAYFGLFYDASRNRVCAFGGKRRLGPFGKEYRVRECEGLRFGEKKWESLGKMHKYRQDFSPCLHKALVYLYGFWEDSIESFDPCTNTFTLIPRVQLPSRWLSTSDILIMASIEEELLLIGDVSMKVVSSGGVCERAVKDKFWPNRCVGVRKDEWLYYAREEDLGWLRIDLKTGRVESVGEATTS